MHPEIKYEPKARAFDAGESSSWFIDSAGGCRSLICDVRPAPKSVFIFDLDEVMYFLKRA